MKLRDAEQLLKLKKLEGPITEPWVTYCDDGTVLEAWPLGMARGSWGIRDLFTCIPHWQYSALFHGHGTPHHMRVATGMRVDRLWEQEQYVYYRELAKATEDALTDLASAPFFQRQSEIEGRKVGRYRANTDERPYPEDFELFWNQPRTSVQWHTVGLQDISDQELASVKTRFCKLLGQFAFH